MGIENDRYHANTARISNSMLSVLKRAGLPATTGYAVGHPAEEIAGMAG